MLQWDGAEVTLMAKWFAIRRDNHDRNISDDISVNNFFTLWLKRTSKWLTLCHWVRVGRKE